MLNQWTAYGFSAGLGVALLAWGIYYAYQRGRKRGAKEGEIDPSDLPDVKWLNGEDSPTGRRVLDCRAYALGVQLVTQDKDALEHFADSTQSDGSELEGQSPPRSWLVDVDWQFDFEQAEMISQGMRPQVNEDMWLIDCIGSRLYFRRSWTGQLVFMSNFQRIPSSGASISRIWAPGEEPFSQQSPEYLAAYVRHLIDTHLLGTLTPFPIPPDFPRDEKKIAEYVFHSVGRRGWLAEYFRTGQPNESESESV